MENNFKIFEYEKENESKDVKSLLQNGDRVILRSGEEKWFLMETFVEYDGRHSHETPLEAYDDNLKNKEDSSEDVMRIERIRRSGEVDLIFRREDEHVRYEIVVFLDRKSELIKKEKEEIYNEIKKILEKYGLVPSSTKDFLLDVSITKE